MAAAPAPINPVRVVNGGRPAMSSLATANTATSITTGPVRTLSTVCWPVAEKYQPNTAAPTITVAMSSQNRSLSRTVVCPTG
jgi:hypothetical protein